ncbi:MAG TPA: hypothetical protein VHD34_05985 [Xanthobacteraceae bacterium]|nr:hypothetical protein [Xanthobacteraceae bacterium]
MTFAEKIRARAVNWLRNNPDDGILRWLFRVLVIATVTVVGLDYYEMLQAAPNGVTISSPLPASDPSPSLLPSILPSISPGKHRRIAMPKPNGKLSEKMTFELLGDGKLYATGMIYIGVAKAFKAEVEKRGGYVKTVVLNSTGGSVQDALAMGRLIRAKKFATEVENGGYCASSCPLLFAGGIERRAGDKAVIGVHQAFSPGDPGFDGARGMAEAQQISAECQNYLAEMGVDLRLWVHAMETPKEELYFLKPEELLSLKLATQRGTGTKSAAGAG